jgi:hypothetical protein
MLGAVSSNLTTLKTGRMIAVVTVCDSYVDVVNCSSSTMAGDCAVADLSSWEKMPIPAPIVSQ